MVSCAGLYYHQEHNNRGLLFSSVLHILLKKVCQINMQEVDSLEEVASFTGLIGKTRTKQIMFGT